MTAFPRLVREAKTPCTVTVATEDIGTNGEPLNLTVTDKLCNYQSSARKVRTSEKTWVEVSGSCLFDGDIAPGVSEIVDGTVEIFGEQRGIIKGTKARNPDGTVNYTRLDLE